MPQRILVADKLADQGLDLLRSAGAEFDVRVGLKEDELASIVGQYDALIVRSGAKVTAKVLADPGRLRVIARAGVGVDNIDLEAATAKGVLVLNTPEASTASTAEHAIALMLALARKIPQAHAHVISGGWKRGDYQGTQLAGKKLGLVGLGRVGLAVAVRALAMEMTVVSFNPFILADTALDGRVRLIRDFDEFLGQLDVVSFHVPGGPNTRQMLNRHRLFNVCKPTLLVVNDSRGEVIDEIALADALRAKKIAGAAIDVYETEPPIKDHPLFGLANVVLTPHLGASTEEAQRAVSVEAAAAILAYLNKRQILGAVNATGLTLDLPPEELPFINLAMRLGQLAGALAEGPYKKLTLRTSGPRAQKLMSTLLQLAAAEMIRPISAEPVNAINVEFRARQMGIELARAEEPSPPPGLAGDIVGLIAETAAGKTHRIFGTVYADGLARVVRIDGFTMDMIPEGPMTLITNKDEPGVIGVVGTSFGDAGVNIADMTVARQIQDGKAIALMVIKTDSEPPPQLLERLRHRSNLMHAKSVVLPPRRA